jgi:IS605 OrfB family transposase
MIRTSRTTLKFLNKRRREELQLFLDDYSDCVKFFVDLLWDMEKVPTFVSAEIYKLFPNNKFSARLTQVAAQQASAIIRRTRSKQDRIKFVLDRLKSDEENSKRLEDFLSKLKVSKPNLKTVNAELSDRFFKIQPSEKAKFFDGWISLKSVYKDGQEIAFPYKKTKHFVKLEKGGCLKGYIILSNNAINFLFEVETKENKSTKTLGLDIGVTNVFTLSDGKQSGRCHHGHDLSSIQKKLSRKRKGSKAFKRAQNHRKDYINWSINRIDFDQIGTLKIEDIKNLGKGKRKSRFLQHWNYRDIFRKLEMKCEEFGVQVQKVSPTYTSQRCHNCGWTQKKNRNGKLFKCRKCDLSLDSDLNGAINISLELPKISSKERQSKKNLEGFYLHEISKIGQEPVVPDSSKAQFS